MDDFPSVAIIQRRQHLLHDFRCFLLREELANLIFLNDLVEELPSLEVVHYNQEGVSVFEEFVYFHYGWVILENGGYELGLWGDVLRGS